MNGHAPTGSDLSMPAVEGVKTWTELRGLQLSAAETAELLPAVRGAASLAARVRRGLEELTEERTP